MIPKVIHYCWFGKKSLPTLAVNCIDSWKKFCPDYEIIEWNEKNFDINNNTYVREAYENKKWAFVSDYVRLYALYNYGGIYMDTDVQVLKPLDSFLNDQAFSGFETYDRVQTGIMGAEKKHHFFKELLDCYTDRRFVLNDGKFDYTTNVEAITRFCTERGLLLNNTEQTVEGVTLYPFDYFCPKDYDTKKIRLTKNSYTIHHFDGTWIPKSQKIKGKIQKLIGKKMTNRISEFKKKLK